MKRIGAFMHFCTRALRRVRMAFYRPMFGAHGEKFWFDPDGLYSYRNIFVGDNVNLGMRPILMAELSRIRIGSNVMFGPEVTLIGGGHNTTVVGRFMSDVHEKSGNEDLGVVIDDDVWIGARVVVLRGVTVGRGSVVGAASLVTKSVPPYSIVGGNPARVLGFRFTVKEILHHESKLYPHDKRISIADLERWQANSHMLPPLRQPMRQGTSGG